MMQISFFNSFTFIGLLYMKRKICSWVMDVFLDFFFFFQKSKGVRRMKKSSESGSILMNICSFKFCWLLLLGIFL